MIARVASILLGLWLMAAPDVLHYGSAFPATVARVLGPIATAISIVAISEVTRAVRWVNVVVGVALVAAVVVDHGAVAAFNHALVGAALGGLSAVRGRISERMGEGWRGVRSVRAPDRGRPP